LPARTGRAGQPDCLIPEGLQEQTGGIDDGREPIRSSKLKFKAYCLSPKAFMAKQAQSRETLRSSFSGFYQ